MRSLLLTTLFILTAGQLLQAGPRQQLKGAQTAFDKQDFEVAAEQFYAAAEAAEEAGLDPAVAYFNLANTLAAEGPPEEAIEAYQKAIRTEDMQLQGNALFNMGNTQLKQGQVLAGQGQAQEGLNFTEEALKNYQQSILLDPSLVDRKNNFEMAVQQKELLEEMAQQQQQQQDQNQDQESQEQQPNQDQQQNPEQQQGENEDQRQQDQQNQDQQQEQDQQGEGDQEQQQEQQNPSSDPSEQPAGDGSQQQGSPPPSEEMTPEEARMLLEALKEEENAKREKVRVQLGRPVQVDKDW